ncbi:MAG: FAD-dependent oxidoreductase [Chloroflexi bacterium]|nr:FAD-dependent oxidoreductase [Chloroflexota bacterium]MDA1228471.1 FAD-dependent oxidoreductase [Chloroflexota bacterium]
MQENTYDVIIVGGGVAGLTAGLYTSRAGLKTLLLERMMPGGQVINADIIENFPGFPDGISGAEIGPLIQDQAGRYGMAIQMGEVDGIVRTDGGWKASAYGSEYTARAIIMAGGSTLRKLGVPGEEELHGAGVSYCATCDGGFFMNEVVGVVGGGDSALDEALVLTEFASEVILFVRGDAFSGQKIYQDRVLAHDKIEVRWNTTVDSIMGEGQVEGVGVTDIASGETSRVDLSGVFIYVGLEPNSDYLSDLLPLDGGGHIPTDIWMRTSVEGIFAAGDIRQNSAAQLITSAGDGATAAIAAQRYLAGGVR